jgi:hypothetical protein
MMCTLEAKACSQQTREFESCNLLDGFMFTRRLPALTVAVSH